MEKREIVYERQRWRERVNSAIKPGTRFSWLQQTKAKIPLNFAFCINKREQHTHTHTSDEQQLAEHRIYLKFNWDHSRAQCTERINTFHHRSTALNLCATQTVILLTEMARPNARKTHSQLTTSALFYYLFYNLNWWLPLAANVCAESSLSLSNFASVWICQMEMRTTANWNQCSVFSISRTSFAPLTFLFLAQRTFNSILMMRLFVGLHGRLHERCCSTRAVFAFAKFSLTKPFEVRTWWNLNKTPNSSICMYSLNDYCFCAVSCVFVLRFSMRIAHLLMPHILLNGAR